MKKLFALTMCLLMVTLFAGCSVKTEVNEKTLKQALINAMCIDSDLFQTTEAEFVTYIEENTKIEVKYFEQDGDIVTAKVEVIAPDLYSAAINLANTCEENDLDEVNKLLIEEMKDTDRIINTVDVEFEVSDVRIKAILTDEFLDAYYGGIFKLREKQLEDVFSGMDSYSGK